MASFVVEFNVSGEPVSLQAKGPAKNAWKTVVAQASAAGHPNGSALFQSDVRAAIYYFSAAPMVGDVDNIVKPILDALNNRIYLDDHQVATVVVRKIEPGQAVPAPAPSLVLLNALIGAKPLVYIRISDDPVSEPL